jgi:superfamily I DNA and/or RNA helicase/serine/threonine protein kinase
MPELLLGRFQTMAVEIREGGMSTVKKALDLQTGKFVAVKFLDISSSGELIGPMFRNEVESLKSLKHLNIAKFIESSEPTSDQLVIVTEWIEKRFSDAYFSNGTPNDPWEVLSNIGIPLASAIAHAHTVRICEHRDIKPGNIMIRETGEPVLVDFNISKLYGATDNSEHTVREFQTPIYAPPHEVEPRRFTKDVYSLGVVLLEAIQGNAFTSFSQIAESIAKLPFELQSFFDKSTNQSSAKRIPNGTVMLQELEMLLAGYGQERSALKQRIHLYPQINAIRDLLDDQSIADNLENRRKAETVLMDEIETDLYCEFLLTPEGEYDFTRLRLITKNRWLMVRLDDVNTDKYFLSIYKAGEREEGELDSSRKRAMLIPRNLPFTSGQPKSIQLAFNGKSALIQILTTWHDDKEEKKLRDLSDDKPEIFEQWSLLIDAMDELSTEGTLAATYSDYVVSDNFVDFTLDELPPTDFTGLAVEVLNNQGEPVFKGDVQSQASDVLRIRPAFKPKKLPKSGRIIPSIAGTRTSLARQRNAIDSISIMDESEPNLKSWLTNPELIQVSSEVTAIEMISKDLDESKQIAVRSSLGNSPIHLIQGPPGTGKTEFIAEVVGQFLVRNPLARILIVSQTHVAVDNVLERLAMQGVEDMVRLAPKSNAGVDTSVLQLTLGNQMDSWVKKIRSLCKKNLELEVGKLGISLKDLETVYKLKDARSITLIIEHYKEIKKEVEKRERPTMSIEDPEFERTEEVDEKIEKVLKDLKMLIGEGINVNGKVKKLDLSELSTEAIDAEIAALTSGGEWSKELLATMELQTDWLNRLTNDDSLTSYFLRTRKVIAGTCIGFIGHKALTDLEFDLCIVDEASKATSTEVLVPMSRAKKWILVGDDRQLPPLVDEELKKVDVREKYGLLESTVNQTLFMYLESRMPKELKFQLNYQYRMIDEIGDLISECFYEGTLISQHRKRLEKIDRLIPPILWLDTSKDGEQRFETSSGTSQLNWHEANLAIRQLQVFSGANLRKVLDFSEIKILVMSAYQAQVRQISRMAKDSRGSLAGLNIDIKTIDQVQGRETDIAILSLTRSNSSRSMGFVNDYPRINVALSRAKHGLIIVGDRTMFEAKPNPLGRVLKYIADNPNSCEVRSAND